MLKRACVVALTFVLAAACGSERDATQETSDNLICNGRPEDFCDGLCPDFQTDVNNCGSCGHVCPGAANGSPTCYNGTCYIQCNDGYVFCGGQCIPVSNSNCGACGFACPRTESCLPVPGGGYDCFCTARTCP